MKNEITKNYNKYLCIMKIIHTCYIPFLRAELDNVLIDIHF